MANIYRFQKDVYFGIDSYAISTSSGISQGDLMQWDTGARVANNNALVSGSIFLGVTEDANPLAGLGTPTVPLTGGRARIKESGIHLILGTASETYAHLDPVFQNSATTGANTITNVAGIRRMIGRVHLPDGTTRSGAVDVPVNIIGSVANMSRAPSSLTGDR